MNSLSAKTAAELAKHIYLIQDERQTSFLKSLPVFKTSAKPSQEVQEAKGVRLVAEVGGRLLLSAKDGFGLCAIGGDLYKKQLFIIFRGSTGANQGADWVTNGRIGLARNENGLPVHLGFNHTFKSMLPKIKEFIAANRTSIESVHCIGHSLGGAIASLAADWIKGSLKLPVKLYTFGAPRVGLGNFSKGTTNRLGASNIYRSYHRTDPVPMIPLYPYIHAPYNSGAYFLPSPHQFLSKASHDIELYEDTVDGKSWPQLSSIAKDPYSVESAIEDWLKSKSPVNSESASFWRWLDSALIYVLKKLAKVVAVSLQGVFISGFTLADKLAYILVKGISLAENISIWVELLIRKMLNAVGVKVGKSKDELTRSLIRRVLTKLTEKANNAARKAIRAINN